MLGSLNNLWLLTGLTLMACGDKSADEVCGGNGEMHGSHCDCDAGFAQSEDGSTCVEAESSVDYGGDFVFEPSSVEAIATTSNASLYWGLKAVDEDVELSILIYEEYNGLTAPGSVTLEGDDLNYATCGNCVLLQTGCSGHGDHSHCSRTFMPTEGELRIDAIGETGESFAGELMGVRFHEVTIDSNYQSQQVEGGEQIHMVPWAFDVELD